MRVKLACTLRHTLAAAIVAALAACSTVHVVAEPEKVRQLGFVEPGKVTRAQVEARLGRPLKVYENGRVTTYTLGEKDGRFAQFGPFDSPSTYALVLVFGADDVLERRAVVRVK
jgi:hypothetical protein